MQSALLVVFSPYVTQLIALLLADFKTVSRVLFSSVEIILLSKGAQ